MSSNSESDFSCTADNVRAEKSLMWIIAASSPSAQLVYMLWLGQMYKAKWDMIYDQIKFYVYGFGGTVEFISVV